MRSMARFPRNASAEGGGEGRGGQPGKVLSVHQNGEPPAPECGQQGGHPRGLRVLHQSDPAEHEVEQPGKRVKLNVPDLLKSAGVGGKRINVHFLMYRFEDAKGKKDLNDSFIRL